VTAGSANYQSPVAKIPIAATAMTDIGALLPGKQAAVGPNQTLLHYLWCWLASLW
jgi:hypothetical protein